MSWYTQHHMTVGRTKSGARFTFIEQNMKTESKYDGTLLKNVFFQKFCSSRLESLQEFLEQNLFWDWNCCSQQLHHRLG